MARVAPKQAFERAAYLEVPNLLQEDKRGAVRLGEVDPDPVDSEPPAALVAKPVAEAEAVAGPVD